eukprot:scaffold102858_cov20-Prasinocladus_malaysianus.AAC.1
MKYYRTGGNVATTTYGTTVRVQVVVAPREYDLRVGVLATRHVLVHATRIIRITKGTPRGCPWGCRPLGITDAVPLALPSPSVRAGCS